MSLIFSILIPAMLLLGSFSDGVVGVLALGGLLLYVAYLASDYTIEKPLDSYRNQIFDA